MAWELRRQDDLGNEYLVARHDDRGAADAARDELIARGHHQHYWVKPAVTLRPLSQANVRAVCELRVAEDQERLVAPAAYTIAEAHYEPGALLRAIYLGDEPVGVLAVALENRTPLLARFMVDAAHQRRGVGREAFELLARELRAAGLDLLETSFAPGGAEGFWRACGFEDTGRTVYGERVFSRRI
jgi:diamine N-acetyltransferase